MDIQIADYNLHRQTTAPIVPLLSRRIKTLFSVARVLGVDVTKAKSATAITSGDNSIVSNDESDQYLTICYPS